MNTNIQLSTEKCLLIFDMHQKLSWPLEILEREAGNFSHIVLGGDYFDDYGADNSAGEVCAWLLEMEAQYGDKLSVLLGNHDIHYLEAKRFCDQNETPTTLRYQCSGFDTKNAQVIAQKLSIHFWEQCRLFQYVNGHLISHAGVHTPHSGQ